MSLKTQLLFEAFALGAWKRDPYVLKFSEYEKTEALKRRTDWLQGYHRLVGINTGCSSLYPNKKLSVSFQRELIVKLQRLYPSVGIVLLGGPEDTERNQLIAKGLNVISSPTEAGVRDGLVSMAAVDVLVSGDSYTCVFTEFIAGNVGEDHQNTATVIASDNDGNSDTESDSADANSLGRVAVSLLA